MSVGTKQAVRFATATPLDDEENVDADNVRLPNKGIRNLEMQVCMQQHLSSHYPISKDPIKGYGLLHRLDAQTSGVLLCAKSYAGAYWIEMLWCAHDVTKEYVCLVRD